MFSKMLARCRVYAKNALERRFWPERLIETDTTPFRIIFQDGLMCVRHYQADTAETDPHAATLGPLLLIPPLGVPAWIFDLMHERSFVRFFLDAGWDVYLIDWGSPSLVDAHYDLTHYVTDWLPKAVAAVNKQAGSSGHELPSLSLVGYCMGGLLALMYLGARDQAGQSLPWQATVKNLVTIASPIDFHDTAGRVGQLVNFAIAPLKALEHHAPKFYARLEKALPGRYFHVPGKMVSHAFALTQPLSRLSSYLNLVWNLADRSYVIEHTALARWFDDMLDYPGGVVQNMIFDLVPANRLKLGGMRLGDNTVSLKNVCANLLAVIGSNDSLVTPSAAASIVSLVSSPDTTFLESQGGHAGVFAGHGAAHHTWAPIHHWLCARVEQGE